MDQHENQIDAYNSLKSAFYHRFVERKLFVLMVFTGGFTLGGSFLLLLTAYLIAGSHGSSYTGIVAFTCEAIILLRFLWLIGEWAYTDFKPKTGASYAGLFVSSFLFSLAMPIFFVVGMIEIVLALKSAPTRTTSRHDLRFTTLFNRMAHIN